MSIPMIMLSPLSFSFSTSWMRSLSNSSIGFGSLMLSFSRKYLHCCDQTVLIPVLFLHGRYAEIIVVKVEAFPLSLVHVHLPRPVESSP